MDHQTALEIVGDALKAVREREEKGGGPGLISPLDVASMREGVSEGDVLRLLGDAVDAGTLSIGGIEVYGP